MLTLPRPLLAKTCTFVPGTLNSATAKLFPKECQRVCSDLVINEECDLTEEDLTVLFKNMKMLVGSFTVENTSFTSSRFLAGLEAFQTEYGNIAFNYNSNMTELGLLNLSSMITRSMEIKLNPKLKKFNMPKLSEFNGQCSTVSMLYVAPNNSCLSLYLAEELVSYRCAGLRNVKPNYCTPTADENACTKPGTGCRRILGDVFIGLYFDLSVMKSIEIIFGRLTVNGTRIESMGFLEKLKYIVPFDWTNDTESGEEPLIHVVNNPNLINITFPKLKRVYSTSSINIEFTNNTEEILYDYESCYSLYSTMRFSGTLLIDDHDCYALKSFAEKRATNRQNWMLISGGVLLMVFLILLAICGYKHPKHAYMADPVN